MIEVGEYVRYEGIITKAIDKVGLYSLELDNGTFYDPRDITYEGIKHSKNIIDLIEEGDIVNGHRVYFDRIENKLFIGNDYDNEQFIKNIKINSILTKELFEANCYKVKEEIC